MRKRRPEQWHALVQNWQKSGLPPSEYCRLHGLAHSSFSKWKARIVGSKKSFGNQVESDVADRDSSPEQSKLLDEKSASAFVEVIPCKEDLRSAHTFIRITTSHGCTIEVPL